MERDESSQFFCQLRFHITTGVERCEGRDVIQPLLFNDQTHQLLITECPKLNNRGIYNYT